MRKIVSIPDAARTFEALRSLGYDLNSSVADLVDNSITHKVNSKVVSINITRRNEKFQLTIFDDGVGMNKVELEEAMRIGTRTSYKNGDLGKFGMGMKTASISHCNILTVISKKANCQITGFRWDLNHVNKSDEGWILFELTKEEVTSILEGEGISLGYNGTLVFWNDFFALDDEYNSYSSNTLATNFIYRIEEELKLYLSMIFHRFLEKKKLTIKVNNDKLQPWDPFCRQEPKTEEVPLSKELSQFKLSNLLKPVSINAYILPNKDSFSSEEAWRKGKGLLPWNEAQGYYIYRADRIIRYGGWQGTRALDEHDKLARVSIDIDPKLDKFFRITVNKARIKFPELLFNHLKNSVNPIVSKKAKKNYKPSEESKFKNKFRKQDYKLNGIGKTFVQESGIKTKADMGDGVYVINPNGRWLSNKVAEFLSYGSSNDFEVVSGKVEGGLLWKVICHDNEKIKVVVNENHPFYNKIYTSSTNKNTTNAIDALIFSLAFGELYNKNTHNAQLFDAFKTVCSKTLEKIIKEQIL